jgi:hypothetical protein
MWEIRYIYYSIQPKTSVKWVLYVVHPEYYKLIRKNQQLCTKIHKAIFTLWHYPYMFQWTCRDLQGIQSVVTAAKASGSVNSSYTHQTWFILKFKRRDKVNVNITLWIFVHYCWFVLWNHCALLYVFTVFTCFQFGGPTPNPPHSKSTYEKSVALSDWGGPKFKSSLSGPLNLLKSFVYFFSSATQNSGQYLKISHFCLQPYFSHASLTAFLPPKAIHPTLQLLKPTEEFALDLGSFFFWGKSAVRCLWAVTHVFQLGINFAHVQSCLVHVS